MAWYNGRAVIAQKGVIFMAVSANDSRRPRLASGRQLTIEKEISAQSSKGNLKKWYGAIDGVPSYLKTNSNPLKTDEGKECKSEIICCQLAALLGLPTVAYTLDRLHIDGLSYEICTSPDFTEKTKNYTTIAKLCNKATSFSGRAKYEYVIGCIPHLKKWVDTVLLFDCIINNHDRHLNNFMLVADSPPEPCLCYDYGDSLFSTLETREIKRALAMPLNYTQSKPFGSVHGAQMELIGKTALFPVFLPYVYKMVNAVLEKDRSKLINIWLKTKLHEFDLIKK